MSLLSLAVLAHIDAGKTTLSERLLFHGKSIDVMGEVEEGLSTLDYLPEERRRGITIEAGYANFSYKGRRFQLIDTPGHIDFGVEVDAALAAVESAILVISGVRGVQTQTLTHWHKLRQKQIPVMVMVNKMDQGAHQSLDLLMEIEEALEMKPLVLSLPYYQGEKLLGVIDVIHQKRILPKSADSREVLIQDLDDADLRLMRPYRQELLEQVAMVSDALMEKVLLDEDLSAEEIVPVLFECVQSGMCLPVFFGSAKASVGMRSLMNGLRYLLPDFQSIDLTGQVVKARYRKDLGKYYLFKALGGNLPPDMKWFDLHAEELFESSPPKPGQLCGLMTERPYYMGDVIGAQGEVLERQTLHYPTLLHYIIEPVQLDDFSKLEHALALIGATDPSMDLSRDDEGGCWQLRVVGEVYLDVLVARLRDEFGCEVRTSAPRVQCLENLLHAKSLDAQTHAANGFYQIQFSIDTESDELVLPESQNQADMLKAVLGSVREELCRQGLSGHGSLNHFALRVHTLEGPEHLLPVPIKKMVLDAIRLGVVGSDIEVLEPWVEVDLQIPAESSGLVLDDLKKRGAQIIDLQDKGQWLRLRAELALLKTFGYVTDLRSLTRGHASWSMNYKEYRPRV